jgi:hypothetical protein
MNELLGRILDAHGGRGRGNGYKKVDTTIVSGGGLFPLQGVPQDPSPRRMTAWLHAALFAAARTWDTLTSVSLPLPQVSTARHL